jgi:hypothetical protein
LSTSLEPVVHLMLHCDRVPSLVVPVSKETWYEGPGDFRGKRPDYGFHQTVEGGSGAVHALKYTRTVVSRLKPNCRDIKSRIPCAAN